MQLELSRKRLNNSMQPLKFSIISAVYNSEKYIHQAIESVINQTIDFKENVELILVDDKSTDNTLNVCKQYHQQYPQNIKIVEHPSNLGQGEARNSGLEIAQGEYINFIDSDDYISEKTLEEVYKFFQNNNLSQKNSSEVKMVSIPIHMFGTQQGLHPKYQFIEEKNQIINLEKQPYNFVLSASSCFYRKEVFENQEFNATLPWSEDSIFNIELQLKYKNFGYIGNGNAKYFYRKRETRDSIIDTAPFEENFHKESLRAIDHIVKDKIDSEILPKFIQYWILYDLGHRIKTWTEENYPSREIVQKYVELYKKVNPNLIFSEYNFHNDLESQISSILIQNGMNKEVSEIIKIDSSGEVFYKDHKIINIQDLPLEIYISDIKNNKLHLEGIYNTFLPSDAEVFAQNLATKTKYNIDSEELQKSAYTPKLGKAKIYSSSRKISLDIPIKKEQFEFIAKYKKKKFKIPIKSFDKSHFSLNNSIIKIFHKDHSVKIKNNRISIRDKVVPYIFYLVNTYINIIVNYSFAAHYRLFSRKKKKFWLINDRPDKAGDNGEAIFRYINEHKPQTAEKTYFAIRKDSPDYERLKNIGKVVAHGSLKHKHLFMNASHILSSSLHPDYYKPIHDNIYKYYTDLLDYKLIFLQHGVTKSDVYRDINKFREGVDTIVTSVDQEYQQVSQPRYLYNKNDVALSGLPRFDMLYNHTKNVISIMPTWRRQIALKTLSRDLEKNLEIFKESKYFKTYKKFLLDDKLAKSLEKNNIKLNFILHPECDRFIEAFTDLNIITKILIIKSRDISYRKIFAESQLLITDYSSVAFDFAYLKKPTIYYQFDSEKYFSYHYPKGWYDNKDDSLGEIITNHSELISTIIKKIKNPKIKEKYLNRINKTFKYTDINNSKRAFEHIKRLD